MKLHQKKKLKVTLPPELPPEIPDEDIVVSDEDVNFVAENRAYAGFVSRLDTKSITKHVNRVANAKEDELEELFERRLRKKKLENKEEKGIEVNRVDALPVKTLDGKLYYKTVPKEERKLETSDKEDESDEDKGIFKLTKAERRAKLKKKKKDEKKQVKEPAKSEEDTKNPQSEVLAEVKEDLTAAEVAETKQHKIAELGTALLEDPESNIKSLKELLSFCNDGDKEIAKAALLSTLVVFRDIIPGYRIRLPTEKEQEMVISKAVKKMRFFESTLLFSYKAYLQRLFTLQPLPEFNRVAVRCLCTLLDAHPHFNFRQNIIPAVVKCLASADDVVRKFCSTTIQSIFKNEGKHGGEATVETVQRIADLVRIHDCQLNPDSIEVFLALSFDEDLARSKKADDDEKRKRKKFKKGKKSEEQTQPTASDKKKTKKELLSKTREEVNADFKAASLAQDETERRRMQSQTLSAVFNTYFRVLKHTIQPDTIRLKRAHPLLSSCLKGLGMFSHLIDIDFMADLMKHLKILASGTNMNNSDSSLTVSEQIECCIVAFKVMRKNLDALNVDLQEFFIQLYNLIIEYRPGRDQGEILAEALKIMLCDDRQHDMQRAAAFIKRLASSSLCFGSPESMAALVTAKNLLQKNFKCRYMLENDVGGGSVSGSVAIYQPYSSDPHLSGALASVLWELNLLSKHYHPIISTMASSISKISTSSNQIYMPTVSPQQAYKELLLESEQYSIKSDIKLNNKRKRGNNNLLGDDETSLEVDEEALREKLSDHFTVVHDIVENEKLRRELGLTALSLQLHEEYKKHKNSKRERSKQKKRKQ
ncbi:nucleolar complex protein 3 homolog [Chenopodium quinoa]|uniref:nucleolar complex protein 3 homolog n=1 Tax=Chenopodium quinoa TaxID=63459 RepID=UPI000B78128D|nr:nucleolar complex protein 3 homolog [Chenopodium quinoa]